MKFYIYTFSLLLLGCSEEQVQVTIHEQVPLDIEISCSLIEEGMDSKNLNSIMKGHGLMKAENFFSKNQEKDHNYYWNVPMDGSEGMDGSLNMFTPTGNTCLVWFNEQKQVEKIVFEDLSEGELREDNNGA